MDTENMIILLETNLILDEIDGELIIFNPKTEKTHVFNNTAKYIIKVCNENTIENIIKNLYNELNEDSKQLITYEILYNDVINYLDILYEENLITRKDKTHDL